MKLQIKPAFDKKLLIAPVYTIEQGNSTFKYYNTRLIKSFLDVTCVGSTHEYYNLPNGINTIQMNYLFIDDIGDGGCKDDKLSRDIRLLKEDLVEEPTNGRYYFYLGNSYYDSNNFDEAIKMYEKRIYLGGWREEVWYSYYKLGLCYYKKNLCDRAISIWLEGYHYDPARAENIYEIVKHYRIKGKHNLAYLFIKVGKSIPLPKNRILFLHYNVYNYLFNYEFSIIAYYISPRPDILSCYMKLLNTNTHLDHQHLLSNFKFYCSSLKHKRCVDLNDSSDFEGYTGSTPSIIPYKNGYLANVRYVDYKVERNGEYTYADGHNASTQNTMVLLNDKFEILERKNFVRIDEDDCRVRGIEDVKIIENEGQIYFMGMGQIPIKHHFRVFCGKYNMVKNILPFKIIPSPCERDCEKNWALFSYKNNLYFIYKWNPLTIGRIKDGGSIIVEKKEAPPIFKMMRGSSNGFLYADEYWFVTHIVEHSKPRHYYHCIVVLDGETLTYKRHSQLFTFDGECIEFCLSIIVQKDTIIMSHSCWDASSLIKIYNKKELLEDIFDEPREISIALLIPVCSRNQHYDSFEDIPFMKYLLPSFLKTRERNYNYTIYIGIDSSDAVYLDFIPRLSKSRGVEIRCIILNNCEHKPAHAWNKLFEMAYKDEHDYFYQLGDDIELITPWAEQFIRVLREKDNKGVVGGCHEENYQLRVSRGMTPTIENAFVHRTHYQLFQTFFNKEIENWYCDDWLTEVYKPDHSIFYLNVKIKNHVIDSRYIIHHMEERVKQLIESDRKII